MYTIGALSRLTGVLRETIRYYERMGVLPEPKRSDKDYGLYTQVDAERLNFIRNARTLDFTLDDIAEILAFRERNEPPCRYVLQLMHRKIDEIHARIHNLERLRDELTILEEAGQKLPEDIQMRSCVCHLIQIGVNIERNSP
jgi:DNA-binding transcriptional MerR regulator